jgi:hypothetical protein
VRRHGGQAQSGAQVVWDSKLSCIRLTGSAKLQMR